MIASHLTDNIVAAKDGMVDSFLLPAVRKAIEIWKLVPYQKHGYFCGYTF